jgi:hypothetical protein
VVAILLLSLGAALVAFWFAAHPWTAAGWHHARAHKNTISIPSLKEFRDALLILYIDNLKRENLSIPAAPICEALFRFTDDLYNTEQFEVKFRPPPLPSFVWNLDPPSLDQYHANLAQVEKNVAQAIRIQQVFAQTCIELLIMFTRTLAPLALRTWDDFRTGSKPQSPYSTPIHSLIPDLNWLVGQLSDPIWPDGVQNLGLFTSAREAFCNNRLRLSRELLPPKSIEEGNVVNPSEYNGDNVVHRYWAGTPFEAIFSTRVSYPLPESARKAHTVIVAGSDRGKTQTLEAMTWGDLQQPSPPGMVIIDSKGDMVKRIAHLDVFNPDTGRLRDKLIIVDPRDGPGLAPFDVGIHDLEARDPDGVEEVVNGIITEMGYLFRSLFGESISGNMSGVFDPLVQLMIRVPNASLDTLADAIQDPLPYIKEASGLPERVHKFLTVRYKDLMPKETKLAVERRVQGLLTNSPSIARIFGGSKNNLDLTKALIDGATVLVSTETTFLNEFSPVFGRYLISQTMLAARKRPEHQRKQAYLIVDEAGAYFDDRTETLLRTLRSYGLGGVLAFQDWAQAPATLKAAIVSNTSIKIVGSDSDADARAFAADMKTDPEFILSQGKVDRQYGDFACFVRGLTPKAISIRVPFGTLDKQPRMTDEQYKRMRATNKSSLTGIFKSEPPTRPNASLIPEHDPGDTRPSTDWKK